MATLTSTLIVRLLDKVSAPAKGASKALLGIGEAARKAGSASAFDRVSRAIERNNAALDGARGRMLEAVGAAYALQKTLSGAVNPAINFESAMADVAKVSGFDDEGLAKFSKQLRDIVTKEIPIAHTEMAALAAAAAQAGVADGDLADFSRMTAKTAVAWEMTGAQAGEALAKIMTQLQLTTAQTERFADAINHVSDNTAAAPEDLVEFSKRSAALGKVYGFTAEQTLALGAAMIASGARAETASTSFLNVGRALTRGASATKRQQDAYKRLGLDARKVAKAMQEDAAGTLDIVLDRLRALPKHVQGAIISDLFGDEAKYFTPLLENAKLLSDTYSLVAKEQEYAGSVTEEFNRRAKTTEYALQRLKNQVTDVGIAIGNTLLPTIKGGAEALGPIAERVAEIIQRFPNMTRNVIIGTAGLIGFRIALTGVQFAALMARGGLLSMLLPVARFATWTRTAAASSIGLQAALAGMSGAKLTGWQKFTTGLMGIGRAIPGMGLLKGALTGISAVISGISAPVAAVVGALVVGGYAIYKYWDYISSIFKGVGSAIWDELAPAIEYAQPLLDWLSPIGDVISAGWDKATEALKSFGKWIGSFFSREVLSDSQKAEWENAGRDAAKRMIAAIKDAFSGLISWAADLGSQIGNAIGNAASGAINKVKGWFGYGDSSSGGQSIRERAAANNGGMGGLPTYNLDGARAAGGPVTAGKTYLVGEEGPELFSPSSSGSIMPSSQTMAMLRRSPQRIEPAGLASGSSQPVNVTNNIIVMADKNPEVTADIIMRKIGDKLGLSMRGVHADVGI